MMMTCAEWDDFMHAYDNDIKPGFGAADEKLDAFLSRGIINWGDPVQVQWGLLELATNLREVIMNEAITLVPTPRVCWTMVSC